MASSECNIKHLVELNQSNGVSRILLNDPLRKNALSKAMVQCLIGTLNKIKDDSRQQVVVIRGAKGVFCSGADLEWMRQGLNQSDEENLNDADLFYQLFELLNTFPKPILMWVEKYAMGGALGLLACADYVLAEKSAKMAFSEVKLGLVPATIAPFVIEKIGISAARAYMLSAEIFMAKEAKKIGLVHETANAKDITLRMDALIEQFKRNSPLAMAKTKELLQVLTSNANADIRKEKCIKSIAQARASEQGREGVNAFFDKRRPNWNKVSP